MIDIYSELFLNIIVNHQKEEEEFDADEQAKIILQMILTKIQHLKNVLAGINVSSKNGITLNGIIDPTVVATLIRNVYETTGMFNLIYRSPNSSEEKLIIYNLWVHAGLKYRQRFVKHAKSKEIIERAHEEFEQMQSLVKEIEETQTYIKLKKEERIKIDKLIKDKSFLMRFSGDKVSTLSWRELSQVMGVKESLLDDMYTYFSLYAHPSNVAVFQFAEMFKIEDEAFRELTVFNLKNFFMITSIFIADYINLFPKVLNTYNKLELIEQITINFHNTISRGYAYSINDSWKELGDIGQ